MHGGTVDVETGPERGSRFTVHLPRDPACVAGTPAAARADVASAAEGSERIAAAAADGRRRIRTAAGGAGEAARAT